MNIQQPTYMDKAAFLAWAQGREGRYELVEHCVVMMGGGSKTHALIASRLSRALWGRLDLKKWVILGSDLAVDVSQIIAGIDWVVQHRNTDGLNVRVINLSLGTDSVQDYQLDPLAHAAEVAWRHGIVVVAAVGNDGTTNRNVADQIGRAHV